MLDAAAIEQVGRPMGLSDDAVRRCLDPRQGVVARMAPGGPAPVLVLRSIATQRAAMQAAGEDTAALRRRVQLARETLKRDISRLAADGGPARA